MSAGKKRQTMAKQARERAVREKRELKRERKREVANLRLAGEVEGADAPADEEAAPTLRLVADEEPAVPAVTDEPGPDSAERDEGERHGAHA